MNSVGMEMLRNTSGGRVAMAYKCLRSSSRSNAALALAIIRYSKCNSDCSRAMRSPAGGEIPRRAMSARAAAAFWFHSVKRCGSSNGIDGLCIVPHVDASTSARCEYVLDAGPSAHRLRHQAHVWKLQVLDQRPEIGCEVSRIGHADLAARRIAAMSERHASVSIGEVGDLLPPGQMIATEPMGEDDRWA